MDGTDPIQLLKNLTADRIAERLEELEREEKALRILLRSARARERADRGRLSPGTGTKKAD